jgi:cellulose synthase/poly-beta-1,6-N-acetylglucosamine synthase-like glycosyltransferase
MPFAPTCNLLVRRDVLEHLDGFEERRSGADAELCWRAQAAGYRLGVAREVLMDWLPRERFWDYLEQHYRYGKGALLQRQRFADAGLAVIAPESLRQTVAKGLWNASALLVKGILRSRRYRVHNAVALAEAAYDLGYTRAHRRDA